MFYSDPGQKFFNDYYLEKSMREYEAVKLPDEVAKQRLEAAGYTVRINDSGIMMYVGNGISGALFSRAPKDIERLERSARIAQSYEQEPIVFKDTYKAIWDWFKS